MSPQLHTIVSLLSKLVVFLCQWTARAVLLVVNFSYEALVSTSLLLLSLLVLVFLVFLSIAMKSRVTTLTLARSLSRIDSRERERSRSIAMGDELYTRGSDWCVCTMRTMYTMTMCVLVLVFTKVNQVDSPVQRSAMRRQHSWSAATLRLAQQMRYHPGEAARQILPGVKSRR